MFKWNYRVIQFDNDHGSDFYIQEVYYDENGKPDAYCNASFMGASLGELDAIPGRVEGALSKPVINAKEFDK